MRKILTLLFAMLVAGAMAFAQSGNTGSQSSMTQSSNSDSQQMSSDQSSMNQSAMNHMSDQQFAKMAAQGNAAEVAAGQMAQQKASSDQVKQFGQTLVTDHSKSNDKLQEAASKDNMQLPSEPSAKQQQEAQKLQSMSGHEFDRAFLKNEIRDHRKDIREYEQEANSGQNQQLKQYAKESLPTLKKHLHMAESALDAIGGNSSSSSSSSGK